MKIIKSSIFIGIVIITLSSCNQSKSAKQIVKSDTLIGKTISFTNKLLVLEGKQFHQFDSILPSINKKPKIISIVDGNCMSCVINLLNGVDSIFQKVVYNKCLLIIVVNVQKKDSAFFMRHLQPSIKAKGIILWDNGFNFEKHNKLLTSDINRRTFMVNAENKIVLIGNPIYYPDLLVKYEKNLAELIQEK